MLRLLLPLILLASLAGCAGQQRTIQMNGAEWQVEDLAGDGVLDRAVPTVVFDPNGQVSGFTGCNRFFGSYRLEGARLAISSLAQTKMACPEAVMDQEERLLALLRGASRAELTDGALVLHGDEGSIRLARASAAATP